MAIFGAASKHRWKLLRNAPAVIALTAFSGLASGPATVEAASPETRVSLPVEIAGEAGTVVSVTAHVPSGLAREARSFWLQIHGLEYAGIASVRINQSPWWSLSNETATVAEPGRSYGGIGGGFATLKVTLPLPQNSLVDGPNNIQFRFNFTDGVASGFRVLAFNFLNSGGRRILSPDSFVEENPNLWASPFGDTLNVAAAHDLWTHAPLRANSLPGAGAIHAHCSDCHAADGADLKYFNFSNASIVARSRFHGLTELQGLQIASYIRSLATPNPGRPWNPPYQPGPGADGSAGAGLAWALDNDIDTLSYLSIDKGPAAFRPDSNLDPREIPIAMQLPDWNHWLPRVHPLDFREGSFRGSEFDRLYEGLNSGSDMAAFPGRWSKSRRVFLAPHLTTGSDKWTAELAEDFYSAQLWQLVKTWEIAQKYEPGIGINPIPAATAPAEVGIPNGPKGMGRSALTNEYFNNAWYELQIIVNGTNHRHRGRSAIDWAYFAGHIRDLQALSNKPEAGRTLVMVIKAMQSTDPKLGPENYAKGWRPERNIDPRILVSGQWAPVFQTVPANVKRLITEELLSAWLDKTLQYPGASYFGPGTQASRYRLPVALREISGGRVWEASSQFQAAGVRPALLDRLDAWGKGYTALSELFHY
jgi:hypothetical protein